MSDQLFAVKKDRIVQPMNANFHPKDGLNIGHLYDVLDENNSHTLNVQISKIEAAFGTEYFINGKSYTGLLFNTKGIIIDPANQHIYKRFAQTGEYSHEFELVGNNGKHWFIPREFLTSGWYYGNNANLFDEKGHNITSSTKTIIIEYISKIFEMEENSIYFAEKSSKKRYKVSGRLISILIFNHLLTSHSVSVEP